MSKHRGHGEGTIRERRTKRADGGVTLRYQALAPLDGDQQASLGTFATRREAQDALRQAAINRAEGITVGKRIPTVAAWTEQWLAGRTRLAYNTRRGYQTSFAAMMPYIGKSRLDQLMESDIAVMWKKLADGVAPDGKTRRRGGPLAATTLDKCHRHLSAALRAVATGRHRLISFNPASAEEARPEKGERKRIDPMSAEEVQKLFAATREEPEHPLWVFLITTGVRPGEAQALQWSDIDWDRHTVSISKSVHAETGRGLVLGPTKTRRNRVVTLRQGTLDALRQQRARQGRLKLKAGVAWEDGGFVFSTAHGKPLDVRFLQRRFDVACAAAGIERRRLKETRHTFATLGLVDRVPVKNISAALGHASVAITYDVYSHVIAGTEEDALSHLDRLFV